MKAENIDHVHVYVKDFSKAKIFFCTPVGNQLQSYDIGR